MGERQRIFLPCLSQPIRSVRYRSATQVGYSSRRNATRVAQFVGLEVTDSTYESIYLVAFILAGPVHHNALTGVRHCHHRTLRSTTHVWQVRCLCAKRRRKRLSSRPTAVPRFSCLRSLPSAPKVGYQGKRVFKRSRNRRCLPSLPSASRRRSFTKSNNSVRILTFCVHMLS